AASARGQIGGRTAKNLFQKSEKRKGAANRAASRIEPPGGGDNRRDRIPSVRMRGGVEGKTFLQSRSPAFDAIAQLQSKRPRHEAGNEHDDDHEAHLCVADHIESGGRARIRHLALAKRPTPSDESD